MSLLQISFITVVLTCCWLFVLGTCVCAVYLPKIYLLFDLKNAGLYASGVCSSLYPYVPVLA